MAEEKKETTEQEFVMPSDETVPEKFRGKSYKDVLVAYQESEKLMTRATQEKAETKKQYDELQAALEEAQKQPEPEEEDTVDEYEYLTKAEAKKLLSKGSVDMEAIQKLIQDGVNQAVSTTTGLIQAQTYGQEHGIDNETLEKFLNVGTAMGAKNLDEARKEFESLAKKLGFTEANEGGRTIPVPGSLPGVTGEITESGVPERIERLRAAAKSKKIKLVK